MDAGTNPDTGQSFLLLVKGVLLLMSYWVPHRGAARERGLLFLLCSCTALHVWAYKYHVIESHSVYWILPVALPFLAATYLSALAALIAH